MSKMNSSSVIAEYEQAMDAFLEALENGGDISLDSTTHDLLSGLGESLGLPEEQDED